MPLKLISTGGGAGGGSSAPVEVRVLAADPIPPSYRDIEWDPYPGATGYRVYYTEPGGAKTLYGSYASNITSARVADLAAEKTGILFAVEADYLATATGSAVGDTGVAPPPPARVPTNRFIWSAGATSSGSIPSPDGADTVSTMRLVLKNISGRPMTHVRAGFLMWWNPGKIITSVHVAYPIQGSNDAAAFTPMLFSGNTGYTEARVSAGEHVQQLIWTDETELPTPVPINGYFVVSVVCPPNGPSTFPLTQFITGVTNIVPDFPRWKSGNLGAATGAQNISGIGASVLFGIAGRYA